MPMIKENFRASTTDLISQAQGVEASAGTGKTYSIALLAVRLLLKTDIGINQILMVTFTRAAVAELQLRVRSFVRKALQVARDPETDIGNKELKELVLQEMGEQQEGTILEKLEKASILLEDLPVFTIHGFCGRLLNEYAFETLQVFDAGVLSESESGDLVKEYFHEFWRGQVATMPPEVLSELMELDHGGGGDTYSKTIREITLELVRAGLAGKAPFQVDEPGSPFIGSGQVSRICTIIAECNACRPMLLESLIANKNAILAKLNANRGKDLMHLLQQEKYTRALELIISLSEGKKPPVYLADVTFHLGGWTDFAKLRAELALNMLILAGRIARNAYHFVEQRSRAVRQELAVTTFDDMIGQVRKAVESPVHLEKLRQELRGRYRAVFIDEFQDTDINQYVIFSKLFGDDHYLYYIGDPKQSIYGFRKADIHTYLKAMQDVAVLHRMNVNFRSNEDYIKAMNAFFKPNEEFNTFALPDNQIEYHEVASPPENNKAVLYCDGKKVTPILISEHDDEYERLQALRATVHDMLTPGRYELRSEGVNEAVKCRDISILVRRKESGKAIAAMLSKDGLPVVTVSDSRIFQSPEAEEIWQILTGINELTGPAINRAMVTRIAGIGAMGLLRTDQEKIMERFRKYHDAWKAEGVYVMMQQFLADHGVHERFYREPQLSLERTIANVMQLVDLIHTRAAEKNLDQTDQLRWLRLAIDGQETDDDEYVQRLERDEEAIRIVTIHSSKGLEYPIILCPDLEFKVQSRNPIVNYREEDGDFVSGDRRLLEECTQKISLANTQAGQEFRRLLYVAITRARQACFIFTDEDGDTTIQAFKSAINPTADSELIRRWTPPARPRRRRFAPEAAVQVAVYAQAPEASITDANWRKVSFTRLTPEKESERLPQAVENKDDKYSDFVFRKLRRGAQTGNMLHAIMEAIDFTRPEGWKQVVERMMRRYMNKEAQEHVDGVLILLHHLTRCRLSAGADFTLSEVKWQNRLVELEFDLDLRHFNLNGLEALSTDAVPIAASLGKDDYHGLEGILNGFMDLFFEWNGKFYILDWKSNYLGDSLADYSGPRLSWAMGHNNYHLQYLLYTVAACRYLRLRLQDFDYDKHFGGVAYLFMRGVREEGADGIFFTVPDKKLIENIEQLFQGVTEPVVH